MKKTWITCILSVMILAVCVCLLPITAQAESGIVTKVDGLILDDPADYSNEWEYVRASVDKILDFLDMEGKPDWLKVLLVQDFVCRFVEYDWENLHAGNIGSQSMYNTLTTGKTMCSGYSMLTRELLEGAGVNCRYISCEVLDHAWNAVELNGVWYNMDTTWDDPDHTYYPTGFIHMLRCDKNFGHGRGQLPEEEYQGYQGLTMAEEDFYCGFFGEDLYWYGAEDNTIKVYGDGKEINSDVSNDTHGVGGLPSVKNWVKSAIIPEGIVKMDGGYNTYADYYHIGFVDCRNMTQVHLPVSLTYIGTNSFYGCDALTDIYYAGSEAQWKQIQILDGNEALKDARVHFGVASDTWQDPSGSCGEHVSWELSVDNILRIYGVGDMYDYEEGQAPWHPYVDYIYEVQIESGVTGIGSYAFDDCYRIIGFTTPNYIERIGDYAFADCRGLRTFTFADSVINLGEGVFFGCSRLNSVTLGAGITALTDRMFYDCQRLYGIRLPNNLVSIGDYCFYQSSLGSLTLPQSIQSIGEYAFAYTMLDEIVTSANITKIPVGAFSGCKLITSLEVPSYITEIGDSAFENCDWLATLSFAGNSVVVGDKAFSGCSYLDALDLQGVTVLGEESFSYCSGLEKIKIPDGVTAISEKAFTNCNRLESVEISGSVTRIGAYAFGQCPRLKKVVLSDGVQTIGDYAFSYCIGLTDVTLPDSLVSIGMQAFESCWDLENITLPKRLAALGDGAFYSCELKSVTVPGSVKNLGTGVFTNCDNLQSVVLEEGIVSIGNNTFGQCSSLSSIEMPNTLTTIERSAFSYCSRLKSIQLPSGVTMIGERAFQGCGLTDVYYNGTSLMWYWIQIGDQNSPFTEANIHYAEGYAGVCNMTPSVYWYLNTDGELIIYGNGPIESCGWNSYSDQILSVTILDGVTSVGGGVFMRLKNLQQAQIADTVTYIDSFSNCGNLASIVLPDGVTGMGTFAFAFCYKLERVTLSSGLQAIPDNAFTLCSVLKSVTLPKSITTIGREAFTGCDNLSVVFYEGTKAARQSMNIGSDNQNLTSATWHYEVEDAVLDGQECYYCPECDGYFLPDGTKIQRYPIGDFTKDQQVTNEDVIYLLWHTLFPENYPVESQADFTGDGQVTNEDVIYLLWHTLFPESYPLTDRKKRI